MPFDQLGSRVGWVSYRFDTPTAQSHPSFIVHILTTIRASSKARPDASAMSLISSLHSPFFQETFTHSSCSSALKSPPVRASASGVSTAADLRRLSPSRQASSGAVHERWTGDNGLKGGRCALPARVYRLAPDDLYAGDSSLSSIWGVSSRAAVVWSSNGQPVVLSRFKICSLFRGRRILTVANKGTR